MMETETSEIRKICRITSMAEVEMWDDGDDGERKIKERIRLIITSESETRDDREGGQG